MPSIFIDDIEDINLDTETEEEDIQQCMAMILNSYQNSIPFMRGFGLSTVHYGEPMTGDNNDIVDEIHEQIETYEQRAQINSIDFDEDYEDGAIEIEIDYVIVDEEDTEDDDDE